MQGNEQHNVSLNEQHHIVLARVINSITVRGINNIERGNSVTARVSNRNTSREKINGVTSRARSW